LIAVSEALFQQFSRFPGMDAKEGDIRPTPWLDRALAPVASALLGGSAHAGFANLRNGEMIPELSSDLVVEVAATYTTAGAAPKKPGPLPPAVADFLGRVAEVDRLTYQASTERDPGLLAAAIRALPLPIPDSTISELASLAQSGP
jgi:alpha-galactosidase/6-phospho-beta-glucosidase family protein